MLPFLDIIGTLRAWRVGEIGLVDGNNERTKLDERPRVAQPVAKKSVATGQTGPMKPVLCYDRTGGHRLLKSGRPATAKSRRSRLRRARVQLQPDLETLALASQLHERNRAKEGLFPVLPLTENFPYRNDRGAAGVPEKISLLALVFFSTSHCIFVVINEPNIFAGHVAVAGRTLNKSPNEVQVMSVRRPGRMEVLRLHTSIYSYPSPQGPVLGPVKFFGNMILKDSGTLAGYPGHPLDPSTTTQVQIDAQWVLGTQVRVQYSWNKWYQNGVPVPVKPPKDRKYNLEDHYKVVHDADITKYHVVSEYEITASETGRMQQHYDAMVALKRRKRGGAAPAQSLAISAAHTSSMTLRTTNLYPLGASTSNSAPAFMDESPDVSTTTPIAPITTLAEPAESIPTNSSLAFLQLSDDEDDLYAPLPAPTPTSPHADLTENTPTAALAAPIIDASREIEDEIPEGSRPTRSGRQPKKRRIDSPEPFKDPDDPTCPKCGLDGEGETMIGCSGPLCDDYAYSRQYHLGCTSLKRVPSAEDDWYCSGTCEVNAQGGRTSKTGKRARKRTKKA
ncbi:hypothetical protein SISNIDRAFT_469746 [Sistotremastrum niveocremeum HHB9708]|uniref:Uncharacterized protein n=1 Tax=Sistotremastrum niveocremeum HHB9708 TaxID=1314777 RepID=A0A164PLP5_9AGAM|nr:hypothetical protein SISNIDRAFT_469746 [Sistotremastrum niveocremeum HHB9708]